MSEQRIAKIHAGLDAMMWGCSLPSPKHVEYWVQRAFETFRLAHCRCRVYDEDGKRIPGGAILQSGYGMLVCPSHAILFAQAYAHAIANVEQKHHVHFHPECNILGSDSLPPAEGPGGTL